MALVESIPLYLRYEENATFGIPLEQVWKDLISIASHRVEVVSFYWTLTGEDIYVNSSTDTPVSSHLRNVSNLSNMSVFFECFFVGKKGKGHPTSTRRAALQERVCQSGDQCPHSQNKLHRSKDPKTERFDSYSFSWSNHFKHWLYRGELAFFLQEFKRGV